MGCYGTNGFARAPTSSGNIGRHLVAGENVVFGELFSEKARSRLYFSIFLLSKSLFSLSIYFSLSPLSRFNPFNYIPLSISPLSWFYIPLSIFQLLIFSNTPILYWFSTYESGCVFIYCVCICASPWKSKSIWEYMDVYHM